MTTLIVNSGGDRFLQADYVRKVVAALGNVDMETDGKKFFIRGSHFHVRRIHDVLTDRMDRNDLHLSDPTILSA